MTDTPSTRSFEIRSEARGPHWIAWIVRGGDTTPDRSVVLVGETREQAEANARTFAAQTRY